MSRFEHVCINISNLGNLTVTKFNKFRFIIKKKMSRKKTKIILTKYGLIILKKKC